jgi:hypothetical protein
VSPVTCCAGTAGAEVTVGTFPQASLLRATPRSSSTPSSGLTFSQAIRHGNGCHRRNTARCCND